MELLRSEFILNGIALPQKQQAHKIINNLEIYFNTTWFPLHKTWAFLVAQMVKNLPAMQETQVQSLGWEDPLEKRMAIHGSILAWRIPRTEEPSGLQSMGSKRVGHD